MRSRVLRRVVMGAFVVCGLGALGLIVLAAWIADGMDEGS